MSCGFFCNPSAATPVISERIVNKIIGIGSDNPANNDENAEKILAKKPHIPKEVVANRIGNKGA